MSTRYVEALPPGYIYEAEDIFEKPFGQHGNETVYFGEKDAHPPEVNPIEICVRIVGALHVVNSGAFTASDSANMGGDRELIFAKHPFAQHGDEGIIQRRVFLDGSSDRNVDTYTSADGTDPTPPRDSNGNVAPRHADWHIPAGHIRYLTLRRIKENPDGTYFPFKLQSITTAPDADQALPPAPIEEGVVLEMTIMGVKGQFIPY